MKSVRVVNFLKKAKTAFIFNLLCGNLALPASATEHSIRSSCGFQMRTSGSCFPRPLQGASEIFTHILHLGTMNLLWILYAWLSVSCPDYYLLILADQNNWELLWDKSAGRSGLGTASSPPLCRFFQNEAGSATRMIWFYPPREAETQSLYLHPEPGLPYDVYFFLSGAKIVPIKRKGYLFYLCLKLTCFRMWHLVGHCTSHTWDMRTFKSRLLVGNFLDNCPITY